MKKKTMMAFGAAAALGLSLGIAGIAAETEDMTEIAYETETGVLEDSTVVTAEAETAEETAQEAAEVLETIQITVNDGEPIEIANTAGLGITAASVELLEDESLINIMMVDNDGQQYEFLEVPYEQLSEPELIEEGAFAFIKYTSLASGKERRIGQTGELTYSEAVELYAIDDVYIRSEPDDEADILGVISRGDAIKVLGETATHYVVQKDDVTGYTVRRCISEDEQDAIAAVQAEEAAREAIRIAQEQAAAAQAAAQQSAGSSKHEVKRQKFDDCDGSGHGYYLITYSDGSTATQEY